MADFWESKEVTFAKSLCGISLHSFSVPRNGARSVLPAAVFLPHQQLYNVRMPSSLTVLVSMSFPITPALPIHVLICFCTRICQFYILEAMDQWCLCSLPLLCHASNISHHCHSQFFLLMLNTIMWPESREVVPPSLQSSAPNLIPHSVAHSVSCAVQCS